MLFAFEKTSRISLSCKLVPVQNREYEYGLFPLKFLGLTIQTKVIENNVYVVLFTVLLDEVFSRHARENLKSVDNSRESNFTRNRPYSYFRYWT